MITFPRPANEFFSLLPVQSVTFRPMRNDEFQTMGSASTIAFELAAPLWAADVVLDRDAWKAARRMSARINALEGSIKTFYIYDEKAAYPAADPDGALLGAAEVTVREIGEDRDTIAFEGLPDNYVLTEGDMFSIDFGSDPSRRALFQLLETVSADGDGDTALARAFPHVWPGIEAADAVTLIRPSIEAFIKPGTLAEGATRRAIVEMTRFTALQKL